MRRRTLARGALIGIAVGVAVGQLVHPCCVDCFCALCGGGLVDLAFRDCQVRF